MKIRSTTVVFTFLAIASSMSASTTAFYLNSTDTAAGVGSPFVVGAGQPWLGAGQNLNAEVFFTTSGTTLTIQLVNLIVNQVTDGQSISGVSFNIGDTGGSIASSITPTASGYGSDSNHTNGQLINIASGGAVSSAGVCGSPCLAGWAASNSLANSVASITMHSFPTGTIAGVPAANGYPGTNNSFTNSNHQPDFEEIVTFTLTGITGLGDSSTLSNVVLNFGTQGGQTLAPGIGFTLTTPEPGTLWMMLGGAALMVVAFAKRRRAHASS